ncbi:MAG: HlyD family efflux transporter periplasmic adaptor subunit [Blastocatellia bacterium]|nr:HlyD family efflux transporter periplasmic adaptor subunit [Blastocatellia bacterium]
MNMLPDKIYPSHSLKFHTQGAFSRSLRSLERDSFRRWMLGLIIVSTFLGAWAAWFFLARVPLYSITEQARLEADRAAHAIDSPLTGRVINIPIAVGQEVEAGELLVELENDTDKLQLAEARAHQESLAPQIATLDQELAAEQEALDQAREAADREIEEAGARSQEAEAAAGFAQEEAARMNRLNESGLVSESDLSRATAVANRLRAAALALRLRVARLSSDHRSRESQQLARIERIRRERGSLQGSLTTQSAAIARLEQEIARRSIRAPVSGRLGEVADLRPGSVVREGERIATVIPSGQLKILADFLPDTASGRILPGQPARLRLDGFPWTRYGSISATVSSVATQARDGRIRVELIVREDPSSLIPLQHGLPGTVEVEVERISPAEIVLRAAGKRFTAPGTSLPTILRPPRFTGAAPR